VNQGNKYATGKYWQMQTCTGPSGANDREQPTPFTHNDDSLAAAAIEQNLPPGVAGLAPVYPAPPHCNIRGLTDLGEHLVRRMMDKQMIVDPDHLDVLSRNQVLSLLEAARYSGVISSHSWASADAYPRIYKMGGVVTPYGGNSESFVKAWKTLKPERDPRYYWGIGYGADMNGFGAQGPPRTGAKNPVKYPFKSFDGAVTLNKPKTGERTWDINTDGVAHYGLYPDWVQDLRMQAGNQIVNDMARGAEAYLEMWERAEGVPAPRAFSATTRVKARSVGRLRLGDSYIEALNHAGQPANRRGRVWTWSVAGKRSGKVVAVLTRRGAVGLIAKTSGKKVKSIAARGVAKKTYLKLARLR